MKENKNMNNTEFIMAKGTLTIETFTDMMKVALESHLKGCIVEPQETRKNNGLLLHGLRIMKQGMHLAPVIYMEGAFKSYQDGKNFDEIVLALVKRYQEDCMISDFDTSVIDGIADYDRTKGKICLKLVNTKLNSRFLKEVPHLEFLDLSIIFFVPIDNIQGHSGSLTVTNELMAKWGVDTDELYELAKTNTQRLFKGKVIPMEYALEDIRCDSEDSGEDVLYDENSIMYVAANKEKRNGAAIFLDDELLAKFANKIDNDFYIIPSSIHELIFLSDGPGMEPEDIRGIISEVNCACVDPEDVLSNALYVYRRETGVVQLVA